MTQNLFLVTKAYQPGQRYVNGITSVIVNLVSTANNATVLAAANAAANASEKFVATNGTMAGNAQIGGTAPVIKEATYFDTVLNIGAGPGSGNLFVNKDAYIFKTYGSAFIAGTAY